MDESNINKAHIFGERVIRPPSCPVAVLVLLLELEVSADLLFFSGKKNDKKTDNFSVLQSQEEQVI
jgi:hypothetical protein